MKRILAILVIATGSMAVTTTQVQAVGETVVGTVTDEANAPVVGATVQRFSGSCPFGSCLIETQVTGPSGTFSYPDAPVGQYVYRVAPPAGRPDLVEWWSGGVLGQFRFDAPYQAIPTTPNGVTAINLTLPTGGVISGRVTSPNGTGIASATVRGLISGVSIVTTTTAGDGTYTLGGMPGNNGLVGPAASQYTIGIAPAAGDTSVIAGTLPHVGTYTIAAGAVINHADLELESPGSIIGTYRLWENGARVTSIPANTSGALCPAPEVWNLATFCTVNPFQTVTVTDNNTPGATAHGGPYAPNTYTVRGISFPGVESPLWTTITVVDGDSFECDLPLDNSIVPACTVTHGAGASNGADDVPDASEDAIGDGNGDGVADSTQANVTSLPGVFLEPITIAAPVGSTTADVTATDPATLPGAPPGLDMNTSAIGYSVWVAPGATVAVTLRIADPTDTLTQLWKYRAGSGWTDATGLATGRTHLAGGRTEFVLSLTDGGAGDGDGSANGVILDPIGFGVAVVSYDFGGFRSPIDAAPNVNRAVAGSTVPVKWVISDNGTPVSDPASFVSIRLVKDTCPAGANFDEIEVLGSGSGLTYQGSGLWKFNWKTSKSWVGCGKMVLTLADGSTHIALFQFR